MSTRGYGEATKGVGANGPLARKRTESHNPLITPPYEEVEDEEPFSLLSLPAEEEYDTSVGDGDGTFFSFLICVVFPCCLLASSLSDVHRRFLSLPSSVAVVLLDSS